MDQIPSDESPSRALSVVCLSDSDSEKENRSLCNTRWPSPATYGSDSSPQDADDLTQFLPEHLTAEAFNHFSLDDERRADLWDETEGAALAQSIRTLLALYHQTRKEEHGARILNIGNAFVHNQMQNLSTDLSTYSAFVRANSIALFGTMLGNFANYSQGTRIITLQQIERTNTVVQSFAHIRTQIFLALIDLGIEHSGRATFTRHKYLRKETEDLQRFSKDEVVPGWTHDGQDLFEPWNGYQPTPTSQLNTTFFDPQQD
jgi:hypothetical protein